MITIGRKDRIELPEFDLVDLEAKVDTGAYGNALHCHEFSIQKQGNLQILTFKLLDPEHPDYENKVYTKRKFASKVVKNSGGIPEKRFTITTEIILFGQTRSITFSLTDRKNMKYPVLLGRKFLRGHYLVDVTKKNISHKKKYK